jgi:transposase
MARSHGRSPRGERLRMAVPHGRRKTTTLIAGLRLDGMVAPMVLDGPINGDWFEAYVSQILLPTLRPGDVVIMDNLSSHKRASVQEMIEAKGARLRFLPPYSPDFNPIEMAFSKLKALLRRAVDGARGRFSQESFELREGHLDGIEVGALGREEPEFRARGLDQVSRSVALVA